MEDSEKVGTGKMVYEAVGEEQEEVCANCGALLEEGQEFCPKCGTSRRKSRICNRCGFEIQEGQEFCPKCGLKVGSTVNYPDFSVTGQFEGAEVGKKSGKKKKTLIIIAVSVIAVLICVIASILLLPQILVTPEKYMEQGDYEKAYNKAKTEEDKLNVKVENVAAVESAVSVDALKDPSSFVLRDAYYHEELNDDGKPVAQLVLYICGANSYGASVSSYWYYTWDNEDNEWDYFCSVSDFDDEEYSEYDDDDEKLEKLLNNLGREGISNTMDDGIKLGKDGVKRINNMFEADTLDEIKLLDMNLGLKESKK